jgi:hypothetical protein
MAFYGSASAILSRFEPRPEDDLRGSCDSVDQLTSSVEYIRDFLQLDEDFSDDESDQEIDFEKFSLPTRAKTSPFVVRTLPMCSKVKNCIVNFQSLVSRSRRSSRTTDVRSALSSTKNPTEKSYFLAGTPFAPTVCAHTSL